MSEAAVVSKQYRVTWQRRHGKGFRREEEVVIVQAMDAADLQAKSSALPGRVLALELARLHTCCVCGRIAPWDDNWMWFGTMKQIDDGKPVQKFCSSACRKPGHPRVPVGEILDDAVISTR